MSTSVRRLYESFQPEHYDLSLTVDRKAMTFSGQVVITGAKTGRPSQRLTFHQNGLKITSASIIKHDKKEGTAEVFVSRLNQQDSLHEVRLHSEAKIFPGKYTVTMAFEGTITAGMTGLYPCYFKKDGVEDVLLATQFESHHAREVFPCIDEPEAKASFDLHLTHETGLTALGNMPVKDSATDGDKTTCTFETTPVMSTYLLAFVVGDIHKVSGQTKRGTEVNIWGTAAQPANSFEFALQTAVGSIEYFEDYFGVEYPLPKADHIALPDFSSGAMENWGLITYREAVLLLYPEEASQSTRELIALVVAHETSHQWFGNLVTMQWWDDLWLNESFANMMEYLAVDAQFPDWKVVDTFIAAEGLSALRRDSIYGVQAVRTPVNHPDEISTLFDPSIVYAKGGRLLFMLKNFIGDNAFRSGLSAYFKKHAYGNTVGDDLWAALGEASGKDVGGFMTPWLTQSGYPVLTAEQNGRELAVKQQHFLDDPAKADPDRLWQVPLFTDAPGAPDLLAKRAQNIQLDNSDFAILNRGARGHYLVHYAQPEHRAFVIDQAVSKVLPEPDRLMLLNTAVTLAKAGMAPFSLALETLAAYNTEDTETVWDMMALVLGDARRFVDHDEALDAAYKTMTGRLIQPQYERLGWQESPNDSPADQKLRATILSLGAYAEVPAILDEAKRLFTAYQSDPSAVPAELRGIVFAVAIKQAVPGALDYLLQLHRDTANSDLQRDIAGSITATKDAAEAEKVLGLLQDPKLIKPQDADRWLFMMLRNRYIRQTAWDWMEANWKWVEKTYEKDKSYDYFPRHCANICNTRELQQRYQRFFEPKRSNLTLKRNIQIGLSEIEARLAWLERDLAGVQTFMKV